MKTTPKLIVNGTNFNVKSTELYYDPPLQEGTKIQKQVWVLNVPCSKEIRPVYPRFEQSFGSFHLELK